MIIELDDTLADQCALTQDDARTLLALALQRLRGVSAEDASALLGLHLSELNQRFPACEALPDFGVDDMIRALQLPAIPSNREAEKAHASALDS